MTKQELIDALRAIAERQQNDDEDFETHHMEADDLLLRFIHDHDVSASFRAINKWYA